MSNKPQRYTIDDWTLYRHDDMDVLLLQTFLPLTHQHVHVGAGYPVFWFRSHIAFMTLDGIVEAAQQAMLLGNLVAIQGNFRAATTREDVEAILAMIAMK